MKILQLGKFYPIRGGVEKVMYDLMIGLSDEGVHCDMLCASTEGHPAEIISLNSYANLIIVSTSLKFAGTMLAPAMVTTLRKIAKQYDIIHIHHPDPMATLALYLSGFRGKVVLHWHSDILKQKLLLKFYKPLQNWLIKRADKIVGTTPVYVKQSSFLSNVQKKVSYIPIGVSELAHSPINVENIRKRYGNKHIIFSLGRLVEYKGYEFLIRAAKYLDDNFHIVIGGKGPLHQQLSDLIVALDVQEKVTLLGFISDEEVPDYYVASDIFCLSSIWKTEAFAIVQIEAMALGKPVISTRIPGSGVSWVNQHGMSGLVVDPENEEDLSEAIKHICLDDQLYEQLSSGSRNRYIENFTRKKMIDKCRNVYTETFLTRI